jgi:hypothetical protein
VTQLAPLAMIRDNIEEAKRIVEIGRATVLPCTTGGREDGPCTIVVLPDVVAVHPVLGSFGDDQLDRAPSFPIAARVSGTGQMIQWSRLVNSFANRQPASFEFAES